MELLGADRGAGHERQPHPEGRRQRGAAGLGGLGGRHPLLPRIGDGPAPLPVDGAGVPAGHRRRGPGAVPGAARRRRSRRGGGLRRRRLERRRASSPGSPTPPPSDLVAVEAAGGAAVTTGIPGVLHGMRSALIQDEAGQILEAESISAGLDYPGIGPEHAHLADLGRARYVAAGDEAVLEAFQLLARTEGILPALESAHALAWVVAAAGSRRARPGLDRAGQPVRAGATRTSPRCGTSCGAGRDRAGRDPRAGHPRGARCGPAGTPGTSCWSPTSPAGSTTSGCWCSRRWPAPAPTPSRWASRSPTR